MTLATPVAVVTGSAPPEAATTEPTGSVVLDIGDDVGALVVHTDGDLLGREVEVVALGDPGRRTHAAVRAHAVGGGLHQAAVITGLTAGGYVLWHPSGTPWGAVVIRGGTVTEVHWDTATKPGEGPVTRR